MEKYPIALDDNGKFLKYAWPGGYPLYHLCADGGVLCADCCNDSSNNVGTTEEHEKQWRIVASDINWENNDMWCDHCYNRIESAYGE